LATDAMNIQATDPELSVLLALEAMKMEHSVQAEDARRWLRPGEPHCAGTQTSPLQPPIARTDGGS
jgi:hypothetical protein